MAANTLKSWQVATVALLGVAGCSAPQPGLVVGDIEHSFRACHGLTHEQCLQQSPYPAGAVFDYGVMLLKP